jgi:hypothetical protein
MNDDASQPARRVILLRQLPALALLGVMGHALTAAAAKMEKADVAYRDRPNDGKRCATCRQFTGVTPVAGTCAVVEGDVSANGWCTAYSPLEVAPQS